MFCIFTGLEIRRGSVGGNEVPILKDVARTCQSRVQIEILKCRQDWGRGKIIRFTIGVEGGQWADTRPDYGCQIHGFGDCPDAVAVTQRSEFEREPEGSDALNVAKRRTEVGWSNT